MFRKDDKVKLVLESTSYNTYVREFLIEYEEKCGVYILKEDATFIDGGVVKSIQVISDIPNQGSWYHSMQPGDTIEMFDELPRELFEI
jgi:hypothetical protein